MKKGISIWAFPSGMKVESCMRLAKEAGFDGIELALNESGELGLDCGADELLCYRTVADEIGLSVTSLATGLYWKYSLTDARSDIREKAKGIVKKQLDAAAVLGVDAILVVPGNVGADFASSEPVPYDVAYDRALSAIRELAPYAAACKVHIGVENVWNKFLLSPLEMRRFIDEAESPWVGAYFDAGNVLVTGFPEHWISILGKRIRRVHVKDFRRSVGNLNGFVDLLSGDVNFPAVMGALEAIGYKGWVTAEVFPGKEFPEQTVWQASRSMDAILGRI